MTAIDLRKSLLVLMEPRAVSNKLLAKWLQLPRDVVRTELRAMRGDGLIRQMQDSTWALTTPTDPTKGGRPRAYDSPTFGNLRTVHDTGPDGLSALRSNGAGEHASPLRGGTVRTLIIDGQAYDAISIGSAPVTRDYQTGSALMASHHVSDYGRRHVGRVRS